MRKPEVYLEPTTRALKIIDLLEKEHSDARIAIQHTTPLQLLVATILSAQCTDERVNKVTKTLFKKYAKAKDYANVDLKELEVHIKSTGFYRNKAKNIKKCCQLIVKKFNSRVPRSIEELLELPGVGRKTANIVLSNAYGIISGIAVDTHVRRLAMRLELTSNKNPDKIEKDLMKIIPKNKWAQISDLLIFHGRRICTARKPTCNACVLNKICPSAFSFES